MLTEKNNLDYKIAYEKWQSLQITSTFIQSVTSIILNKSWKEDSQFSGSCQGLGEEGNGELVFNWYGFSLQNEKSYGDG